MFVLVSILTARFQNRLKTASVPSLSDLTARSKAVSARLLAEHIRSLEAGDRVAVLTGKSGADFDDALESVDAARCGLQNGYQRRPALQVLPLVLNLLIKTANGWVIVDHKTHRVKVKELEREALKYSGQLLACKEAVEAATAEKVAGCWIHFAVEGKKIRINAHSMMTIPLK